MTLEERVEKIEADMSALSANVFLVVNYCRELAKVHLSAAAIARIEAELEQGLGGE